MIVSNKEPERETYRLAVRPINHKLVLKHDKISLTRLEPNLVCQVFREGIE